MKNLLLLILIPFLFFAQKKETIKLNYPVKDYTGTTKSLAASVLSQSDKNR